MPRGGRRQGTPGQQYANRTDLAQSKLPVQVVHDQPYGQAGQQQAAQQAISMASPPPPAAGLAPPAQSGGPPPGQPPPAPQGPLPGQLTPLTAPTQRPNEPLTTGISTGPGAGPEVLGNPQRNGSLGQTLADLARTSGNSDLQVLAQRATALNQ